jgi:hypothetical protein
MSGQLSRDARRVEGTSSMGEGEGHGRFYLGVVAMGGLFLQRIRGVSFCLVVLH